MSSSHKHKPEDVDSLDQGVDPQEDVELDDLLEGLDDDAKEIDFTEESDVDEEDFLYSEIDKSPIPINSDKNKNPSHSKQRFNFSQEDINKSKEKSDKDQPVQSPNKHKRKS